MKLSLEFFLINGSWPLSIAVWVGGLLLLTLLISYRTPIRLFSSEVKVELMKASWPWEPKEKGMKKYKELIDSTVIVVIAMLLLSGYVAGWDFLLNIVTGYIFGTPTKMIPLQ